jgi:hypothetical protein
MSPIQYDLDFGDFSEHLLAVVSYKTRLLEKNLLIQMLIDFAEQNRLTIPRNASINRIEPPNPTNKIWMIFTSKGPMRGSAKTLDERSQIRFDCMLLRSDFCAPPNRST